MQIHASCAAQRGAAVLVTGPPGSGKSDLVLRLLDHGFMLVADDRVMIDEGRARAPAALQGLLEVRGVGIVRMEHLDCAELRLLVRLTPGISPARLPQPSIDPQLHLPTVSVDPWHPSAPHRIAVALRCATGALTQVAGAFAA